MDGLSVLEAAALQGAEPGTRLLVVVEPIEGKRDGYVTGVACYRKHGILVVKGAPRAPACHWPKLVHRRAAMRKAQRRARVQARKAGEVVGSFRIDCGEWVRDHGEHKARYFRKKLQTDLKPSWLVAG
ncbi:MAG: hypothetical protein ACXVHI_06445 [Frankiaceae bacterium]